MAHALLSSPPLPLRRLPAFPVLPAEAHTSVLSFTSGQSIYHTTFASSLEAVGSLSVEMGVLFVSALWCPLQS